ncbi:MAG: hypothetical protein NDI81_16885 [Desulfobacula sp.]|nr:hypothetical protein [Desulfobacula sp.]MDA8134908.1 hypothetical protein [Desulfobacteraceae bacterium]
MKFSDLFVPKYVHSDPQVRMKFVAKSKDVNLLEQMAVKDGDEEVRLAAVERAKKLKEQTL